MTPKVFVSYKTGKDLSFIARTLVNELEHREFDVWFDEREIEGGEEWNNEIYEAIPRKEVLVLLLAQDAMESDWVRREVDIAKGAQVTILPVLIEDGLNAQPLLEKFDIPRTQYMTYLEATPQELNKLVNRIVDLAKETREKRRIWFESMLQGNAKPIFKDELPSEEKVKSYKLDKHWKGALIHLATGDVTDLRNIDVLINPENSYMQMARVFDAGSVSSKVRFRGSRIKRSTGQIREDSVQRELSDQITLNSDEYALPIDTGGVVPTTAGHPDSELRRMGFRYVLHVVTVTVQMGAGKNNLVPIADGQVDEAVRRVCWMTTEINRLGGVISPEGTPAHDDETNNSESYKRLTSVVFPMFATGRGGRETDILNIARSLIEAIIRYLQDFETDEHFTLEDVHLCAYSKDDKDKIESVMDELLVQV